MSMSSRIKDVVLWERGHRNSWLAWLALSLIYCLLIWQQVQRPVWYDELLTFLIANAPSFHDFFHLLYKWDLTPPLLHLLMRASTSFFGSGNLAIRLPSVLAFYGASFLVFVYAKRKLGLAYALIPVLLLWYSPFFQYATEARPYALVALFFSLLLVSWDAFNVSARNRSLKLTGIAVASTGLVLSQVFAPLSIAPFVVAELVRERSEKRIAFRVWAALLSPLLCTLLYVPLLHGYNTLFYPTRFQASFRKVGAFFWHALSGIPIQVLLILSAMFLVWRLRGRNLRTVPLKRAEAALFLALLSLPLALNGILFWWHGAFWDRYCITTVVALYILAAAALDVSFDSAASVACSVSACILAFILFQRLPHPSYDNVTAAGPLVPTHVLTHVRPTLPLVAASGLTFVEMNRHESQDVLSRLYYLTDREAAVHYAHTNLFERLSELRSDFGLRGTVEPYPLFLKHHREFLVLGTPGYPEDWLLSKLAHDGARIMPVGTYDIPYKDTTIYDVIVTVNG